MKTAISIPDEVYSAAERAAKALGVSRSELYTNAIREFVARYGRDDITKKLNEVYTDTEANSGLDAALDSMQRHSVFNEDW